MPILTLLATLLSHPLVANLQIHPAIVSYIFPIAHPCLSLFFRLPFISSFIPLFIISSIRLFSPPPKYPLSDPAAVRNAPLTRTCSLDFDFDLYLYVYPNLDLDFDFYLSFYPEPDLDPKTTKMSTSTFIFTSTPNPSYSPCLSATSAFCFCSLCSSWLWMVDFFETTKEKVYKEFIHIKLTVSG